MLLALGNGFDCYSIIIRVVVGMVAIFLNGAASELAFLLKMQMY